MLPTITFIIVAVTLGVALSSNLGKITRSKKEQLTLVVIMYALLLMAGLVFHVFDPLISLLA